ncbi:peptide chain release factor N(5)-glutamine methyltransferase [Thioclava sp. BHET1]|nr:peptide chain release factor N(5)-glutamine methyltransferase [Thioclava sp. BHET1]
MNAAGARLEAAGIARADARVLMAHAFGPDMPRHALSERLAQPLPPETAHRFEAAIAARLSHQPVSQIIGARLFWKDSFRVTRDTLDPRPETETLIAAALEAPFTRLLDLGTGTGCILISLLKSMPGAQGVGTDLSPEALEVARGNGVDLGVDPRARWIASDWLAQVTGEFDLIVSNPPYIAADEMVGLSPDVRDWEPHLALSPGGDGLEPYRVIARDAGAHLTPGGRLMFEIGPTQAAAVSAALSAHGFERIEIRPDLDGRDRVVLAYKPMDTGGARSGIAPTAR